MVLCNMQLKYRSTISNFNLCRWLQKVGKIFMTQLLNVRGNPVLLVATGGTITTSGDFKIHTFIQSGTFMYSTANAPANNQFHI